MAGSPDLSEKSNKIFRGLSGSYDAVLDLATLLQDRRWKKWVTMAAQIEKGTRVLDLGCGTCVLEERLGRGFDVIGLDLSKEMLRVGKTKPVTGVESLIQSDAQRLPLRDNSFDSVLSCYVVKYCNPALFVSEASRVLKDGGRLVLYDFVRPRGNFWPANAIYTYGGLRVAGALLRLRGANSAYTFSVLPQIIGSRPWEVGFAETLARHGFSLLEERLLSGGAAVGFSCVKQG